MNNIVPQQYAIGRRERAELNGHEPLAIWFIGLSGSGKSTIANLVEKHLFERKMRTFTLDGDNIRGGINKDLGFSEEDRTENLRRMAEVAKLFLDSGTVVLSASITPLESDREMIRQIVGPENFVEVFVDTPLEECENRDVKGLYKRARAGEIKNFTGISAPFEKPKNPQIHIRTKNEPVNVSVQQVIDYLETKLPLK